MKNIANNIPSVTVITLTRLRPHLIMRAIQGVQSQKSKYPIAHTILIDNCLETQVILDKVKPKILNLEVIYMSRQPGETSGPGRSSRLRNFGTRCANSNWIAFLDDDNEWLENHIESLMDCALTSGVRAVHSHLQMFNADGTPYLEQYWPWTKNQEEGRKIYWEYVQNGVYTPGSNIVRDRADPLGHPNPVRSVDTNAWLLSRDLLLEVPFRDAFSDEDAKNRICEDDKLLEDLISIQEPIVCTNYATLKYYLGGYSNNLPGIDDPEFSWCG